MRSRFAALRPLKVSECAFYMGVSVEWIRKAITEGVVVHGAPVTLKAEELPGKRCTYLIHEHHFIAFLHAIGWQHVPPPLRAAPVDDDAGADGVH